MTEEGAGRPARPPHPSWTPKTLLLMQAGTEKRGGGAEPHAQDSDTGQEAPRG